MAKRLEEGAIALLASWKWALPPLRAKDWRTLS